MNSRIRHIFPSITLKEPINLKLTLHLSVFLPLKLSLHLHIVTQPYWYLHIIDIRLAFQKCMRCVGYLFVQPHFINEWALVASVLVKNVLIAFVSQKERRGARPNWRCSLGVAKRKELIHYVPVLQVDP